MSTVNRLFLPPLMVDNGPKVLYKMTTAELRTFVSTMLKAVFGIPEVQQFNFSEFDKPVWWPSEIRWCQQFYEQIPSSEDRACYLRHAIATCYTYYKQEDTLHLFDTTTPNEPPRWSLVQNNDGSWKLLRAQCDVPIWHFPNTYRVLKLLALRAEQDSIRSGRKRKHLSKDNFSDAPARNTRRSAPIGVPFSRHKQRKQIQFAPEEDKKFDKNDFKNSSTEEISEFRQLLSPMSTSSESECFSPRRLSVSIMGSRRSRHTDTETDEPDELPKPCTVTRKFECAKCLEIFTSESSAIDHEIECSATTRQRKAMHEFMHSIGLMPKLPVIKVYTEKPPDSATALPKPQKSEAEIAALSRIAFSSRLGMLLHGVTPSTEPVSPTKKSPRKKAAKQQMPSSPVKLATETDAEKSCEEFFCQLKESASTVVDTTTGSKQILPQAEEDRSSFATVVLEDSLPQESSASLSPTSQEATATSKRETRISPERNSSRCSNQSQQQKQPFYPIVYRPQRIIRHYHELKLTNVDRRKWWAAVRRNGLSKASYKLYKSTCKAVEVRLPKMPRQIVIKYMRLQRKSALKQRQATGSASSTNRKNLNSTSTPCSSGNKCSSIGPAEVRTLKRTRSLSTCIALGVKKRLAKSQAHHHRVSYLKLHNGLVDSNAFRTHSANGRSRGGKGTVNVGKMKDKDNIGVGKIKDKERHLSNAVLASSKHFMLKREPSSSSSSRHSSVTTPTQQRSIGTSPNKRLSPKIMAVSEFCQSQTIGIGSLVPIQLPISTEQSPPASVDDVPSTTVGGAIANACVPEETTGHEAQPKVSARKAPRVQRTPKLPLKLRDSGKNSSASSEKKPGKFIKRQALKLSPEVDAKNGSPRKKKLAVVKFPQSALFQKRMKKIAANKSAAVIRGKHSTMVKHRPMALMTKQRSIRMQHPLTKKTALHGNNTRSKKSSEAVRPKSSVRQRFATAIVKKYTKKTQHKKEKTPPTEPLHKTLAVQIHHAYAALSKKPKDATSNQDLLLSVLSSSSKSSVKTPPPKAQNTSGVRIIYHKKPDEPAVHVIVSSEAAQNLAARQHQINRGNLKFKPSTATSDSIDGSRSVSPAPSSVRSGESGSEHPKITPIAAAQASAKPPEPAPMAYRALIGSYGCGSGFTGLGCPFASRKLPSIIRRKPGNGTSSGGNNSPLKQQPAGQPSPIITTSKAAPEIEITSSTCPPIVQQSELPLRGSIAEKFTATNTSFSKNYNTVLSPANDYAQEVLVTQSGYSLPVKSNVAYYSTQPTYPQRFAPVMPKRYRMGLEMGLRR